MLDTHVPRRWTARDWVAGGLAVALGLAAIAVLVEALAPVASGRPLGWDRVATAAVLLLLAPGIWHGRQPSGRRPNAFVFAAALLTLVAVFAGILRR